MNVEYINPFIDATLNVLKTMSRTEAMPGKPYLKKDQKALGDVSAVIGLTGEANGTIVGEISNMISGQARQQLEKTGKLLHGSIPSVIVGKNHQISHFTTYPVIAVPFETPEGGFTIEVCIEE